MAESPNLSEKAISNLQKESTKAFEKSLKSGRLYTLMKKYPIKTVLASQQREQETANELRRQNEDIRNEREMTLFRE